MKECRGFGETVLSKVLYYADRESYLARGQTISGLAYVRQDFGPTPAPSQFKPLLADMKSKGMIEERQVKVGSRRQRRFVPLVDSASNRTALSEDDVRIIDEVASRFAGESATSISEKSHQELAWKIASRMEELPSFTNLLSEADPTEADIAWAKQEIEHRKASSS